MVTAVSKKMNRNASIKTTTTTIIAKKTLESINGSISAASGFRLLIEANGGLGNITYSSGGGGSVGLEMCETLSTVSKNSIYKQRIDAMFDDSRWEPKEFAYKMIVNRAAHLRALNYRSSTICHAVKIAKKRREIFLKRRKGWEACGWMMKRLQCFFLCNFRSR